MNTKGTLLEKLKTEAMERGLLEPDAEMSARIAFRLVRDMPYMRASDRQPETLIREWRGTCSGKHYLLKDLYAEMGIPSRLMACTHVAYIDPKKAAPELRQLLEQTGGRFVDVHNYLVLELSEGEMIVDATWPQATAKYGFPVNEYFKLGSDQQIACDPIECWPVPEDRDPQDFKQGLLMEHFTPEELEHRDQVIRILGNSLAAVS